MTITAKMIKDSVCANTGVRLATIAVRYPRMVHAELMTHRVFSRNASSSRAIPVSKQIEEILIDPAFPVRFGANQGGMQDKGTDYDAPVFGPCTQYDLDGIEPPKGMSPRDAWLLGRDRAVELAQAFAEAGYHKQVVNRILEPWAHIVTLVSSTDWSNFWALRCHEDADPTMEAVADAMHLEFQTSKPQTLLPGEWHLPFIHAEEMSKFTIEELRMMSAARCARVSYRKHDNIPPTLMEDIELFNRLVRAELVHASPTEHQATPDPEHKRRDLWGNFHQFIQFRKTIPNEAQHELR